MNLIIIRDKLKEGLDMVSRFSSEAGNLPILKNVLFRAEENKIFLTTTNLEGGMVYTIPGKVIKQGSFTVPASLLAQVVNNIQEERLNIVQKEGFLEVITDNYQAKIQGSPAEEFPLIPKLKNMSSHIELDIKTFRESLDQTLVATQLSDLRPELNSILFSYDLNKIRLVGTDSFRLAEKAIPESQFSAQEKKEWKILIPLKTGQELSRVLKGEGKIKMYKDENQLLFVADHFELVSRTLDGTFPDYESIVPKQFHTEVTVSREEFMNAIKLTGVMASQGNEITIKSSPSKKTIELFSKNVGQGDNTYMLSAKVETKHEQIEANFNWRFLLDGLKYIETEEVLFGINEEHKPAMLRAPQKSSYYYIVMPILKG